MALHVLFHASRFPQVVVVGFPMDKSWLAKDLRVSFSYLLLLHSPEQTK